MASLEEFRSWGAHKRGLEAVVVDPVWGKRARQKAGRANGPRSQEDQGRVFQALRWSNYPGLAARSRPEKEGCWR